MKRNIITLASTLYISISSAFAYTEPECTLPISVFQEYVKTNGSNCAPSKITKIAYYSNFNGWMVIGESGNSNKCKFKFSTSNNTDIDNAVLGGDTCKSLSTYTILSSNGVPYACASDSDCDSANGWVCRNISPTYGVGICTQTGCGSNCVVGTGDWYTANSYPEYEERLITKCEELTNTTYSNYNCSRSLDARCAKGAYGTNPKAAPYSGCTQCPNDENNTPGTSAAGSQSITDCYIPSGTTYSDNTGTWQYTSPCHYTN